MGALRKLKSRAGAAEWFDGLQSLGLVVLLVGLPHSEALKSLGLALAALGFVVKLLLGKRPRLPGRGALAALALFYGAAALSVAFADTSFRRPGELLSLAMTLVPYVLVTDACARSSRRLLYAVAIVFGASLASVLGFVSHMQGPHVRLVLGSIENAVPAGEYLAASVALAVAMLSVEFAAPVWGPFWAFASGSSGLALLMTLSRGPLAGAVAGLTVTVGAALRRGRVMLVVALIVLVVVVGFVSANPDARLSKAFSPGGRSVGIRRAVWSASLERALERPVLGHGQGTYRLLNVVYSDDHGAYHQMNAHNTVLHTACETGALGAGTLVLFVVLGLACVVRACRTTRGLDRAVSVGALGGLVALLVAGLFSVVTDAEPGMLFFTLMALGGAAPPSGRATEGGEDGR